MPIRSPLLRSCKLHRGLIAVDEDDSCGSDINLTAATAAQLVNVGGLSTSQAQQFAGMLIYEDRASQGSSNRISTSQLQDYANGIASQAPFGLTRSRLTVTMATATTQRVTDAVEYTMTARYNVPTMLGVLGISEIPITYQRPIFVIAPWTLSPDILKMLTIYLRQGVTPLR